MTTTELQIFNCDLNQEFNLSNGQRSPMICYGLRPKLNEISYYKNALLASHAVKDIYIFKIYIHI